MSQIIRGGALFSVTPVSLVPCSHGLTGHTVPGSAENLNISILMDRLICGRLRSGNVLARPDVRRTAVNVYNAQVKVSMPNTLSMFTHQHM